jgi:hypothetical protein
LGVGNYLECEFGFRTTPHPSPPETSDRPTEEKGEREQIFVLFKTEFDSILQVDVARKNNSVSPLALWAVRRFGRVRVRECF